MNQQSRPRDLAAVTRRLSRRVNAAVWLNHALPGVVLALGLYSVALLLLKVLHPAWADWSLLALALLPAALLWGIGSARRRGLFFRERELVEVIDHLYKNDGAVSAAFECPELLPAADYYARVREAVAPRLPRLDLFRYGRRLLPVLVLTAVSLLLPARPPARTPEGRRVMAAFTQPVLEKIEQFEEMLPEEQAEELKNELESLAESPEGVSREKLEAVEELSKRVEEAVEQSRQGLAGVAGGLQQLASLAGQANLPASSGETEANIQGLLDQLQKAAQDPKRPMSSALRKEICDALRQPPSPEMMQQLSELCDQLSSCMGEDPVYTMEPGMGEGEGMGPDGDGDPGRGGINRGRGDAPMVVGDEKTLANAKYKDSELSNKYLSPSDLVDMGITAVEPKPDPGAFSPGIVKQFNQERGSGVSRTRISPGRRDVISKYFSEPEEK